MCLLVLNNSMHPSSLLLPLSPSPFTSPLPSLSLSIHHPMCRFLSFDSVSRVYHWVLSSGATNGRGVDEFILCTAVCLYVMSWRSLCFCLHLNLRALCMPRAFLFIAIKHASSNSRNLESLPHVAAGSACHTAEQEKFYSRGTRSCCS
jgi:hypothetical protein